ncbi:unnamed protein product [Thlaspi arvense]|uniref:Uncharacterized protein n=1 Tax=Thlaspi arvense TaxID=13288 RepID=A0AAU9SKW8_THLAR|nr:unnamed protein product [Thlaspi arvense]
MVFGQVVIGPPGSGKTTYCNGMSQFLQLIGSFFASYCFHSIVAVPAALVLFRARYSARYGAIASAIASCATLWP